MQKLKTKQKTRKTPLQMLIKLQRTKSGKIIKIGEEGIGL